MRSGSILIVEDDQGILNLLTLYLQKRGFHVQGVTHGEAALKIINRKYVNLIILDIELPEINGFYLCQKIREQLNIPIIFISSRRAIQDKIKGLQLGGDDYLTKPFDLGELEARIRSNLRRYEQSQSTMKQDVLVCGDLQIDLNQKTCTLRGENIQLTRKEFELLVFLARHPQKTYSLEDLYDHVWGYHSMGDPQTVKVHINHLRNKLQSDPDQPTFIHTVRGFGYRFSY